MATLSTAQRKSLPKSDYALPGKAPGSGSYPIEDEGHARAALGRARTNATPGERATIRRKVHEKFPSMKIAGGNKKISLSRMLH